MSDRLEEIRRQRDLLREHLARLDREIAGLEGKAPPSAAPAASPAPSARTGLIESEAEAILARFRQPAVSIHKRTKLGCLLYFAAALVVMALCVAVLYVLVKRAHGH